MVYDYVQFGSKPSYFRSPLEEDRARHDYPVVENLKAILRARMNDDDNLTRTLKGSVRHFDSRCPLRITQ